MVTPEVMYINELCHEVPRFYLVLPFKSSNLYYLGSSVFRGSLSSRSYFKFLELATASHPQNAT